MEYCPPEKRNDTVCIKQLNKKKDDKKENDKKSFSELSETELSSLIKRANDEYYCNNEPIMSDDDYDLLIEYMKKKISK